MRTTFLFMFLVMFFSGYSQKKMVKITGFEGHEINVPDSITKRVVDRFIFYMRTNPISYEEQLRDVKEVKYIKRDRYFVGELNKRSGVLYLNKRLHDYPAAREIVIIHHLAKHVGMRGYNETNPHVKNCKFIVSDWTESMFRKQLKSKSPYRYIVNDLIIRSPLRSKN